MRVRCVYRSIEFINREKRKRVYRPFKSDKYSVLRFSSAISSVCKTRAYNVHAQQVRAYRLIRFDDIVQLRPRVRCNDDASKVEIFQSYTRKLID